jgi:hypothetical protein
MSTRYFQKAGATKPVGTIQFEGYDIIGATLWGVYQTDKPEEIAVLEAALADKKQGVHEITAQEFYATQQKKTPSLSASASFKPAPVVQQGAIPTPPPASLEPPIKGLKPAVVEAEPQLKADDGPPPDSGKEPVSTVAEALKVEEVAPTPTAQPRQSRKQKPAPPTE